MSESSKGIQKGPVLEIYKLSPKGRDALLKILSQPEHTSLLETILRAELSAAQKELWQATDAEGKMACAEQLADVAALCDVNRVLDYANILDDNTMQMAGLYLSQKYNIEGVHQSVFYAVVNRKKEAMASGETREEVDGVLNSQAR